LLVRARQVGRRRRRLASVEIRVRAARDAEAAVRGVFSELRAADRRRGSTKAESKRGENEDGRARA
jgi:hypothetical protein